MNTYAKYCPNVWVAKCTEQHKKDDVVILTTKYGKENECYIHNFLFSKDGFFYYSITRTDGFNSQERARARAERIQGWANNAEKRSREYWEASQEGKDFLSLGEPIKIGHHSEKRHRALIARNWARMGKSVEEGKKAAEYESRVEYWEKLANKIDLSMPESLEYFEYQLEKATEYHRLMKAGEIPQAHSYSLTYAKKEVNELKKKVETAKKLWGVQKSTACSMVLMFMDADIPYTEALETVLNDNPELNKEDLENELNLYI